MIFFGTPYLPHYLHNGLKSEKKSIFWDSQKEWRMVQNILEFYSRITNWIQYLQSRVIFTLFIAYILAHYDYIYLEPHHADSLCGTRCKNKLPIISCICCWTVKNKIFLVQRKYKHIAQKTQDFFRICNLDCISWIQLVWYSWINFLNMYLVSIIFQTYNSRLKME